MKKPILCFLLLISSLNVSGNDSSNQQLVEAILSNQLEGVKVALEKGGDINAQIKPGFIDTPEDITSPLLISLQKGFEPIALFLINKGANIHFKNSKSYAPIHFAVKHGMTDLIKILLKQKASLNIITKDYKTVLSIAYENHDEVLVDYLFSQTNLSKDSKETLSLFLLSAVYYGHVDLVKTLLSKGADPQTKDRNKQSLLNIAKEKKYNEIILLLKQAGAKD